MASTPPTTATRNANLDALQTAVNDWSKKELERLDNEVKFLRAVLQGRAAVNKTGLTNLAGIGSLVNLEIKDFIET